MKYLFTTHLNDFRIKDKTIITMIKPEGSSIILKIEGILRIITIAMFLFSFIYGNVSSFQDLMRVKNSRLYIESCIVTGRRGISPRNSLVTLFGYISKDSTKNVQFIVGSGKYHGDNTVYYDKSLDVNEGANWGGLFLVYTFCEF